MGQIGMERLPWEALTLTATIEPLVDGPDRHGAELLNHPRIATDSIVPVMPSELGRQQRPYLRQRQDAADLLEPSSHLLAGLAELLAAGLATQQEATRATAAAVVRKAQELERGGLATRSTSGLSLLSTETDRSGLLRMQRQTELRKAL